MIFLVEGDGEVRSLETLFKKAGKNFDFGCLDMHGKSNIIREKEGFENSILRQKEFGPKHFCVLIDADHTYSPYENIEAEIVGMLQRGKKLGEDFGLKVDIFWARRAFESWIIGGLEKGDQYCGLSKPITKGISGDTQSSPEDPKEWIQELLDEKYNARTQACFTKHLNLGLAQRRNASLRSFLESF